ncbi:integral membrane protein [Seminavis robusta]|uniref:Integral membrane protein n=1 Tax=Seminavis robusta TaxID=568900 RepID=A0A9N8HBU8_9STRA|nr:integral membrane protein [Seminavis robusta]|eukprot:Sro353_g124410.1 integral membrane protein (438) ;mRNA; r:7032-8345
MIRSTSSASSSTTTLKHNLLRRRASSMMCDNNDEQNNLLTRQHDCPRWPRLFAAPICCTILGFLVSPKFLVLGCVYGLTTLRPLYCCYHQHAAATKITLSQQRQKPGQANAQVEAALALHRSLTFQFAMLAFCLWLYEHSRLLCTASNDSNDVVHKAFDMARHIVRWESAVGLAVEPQIQDFFLQHFGWVMVLANTYYAVMHFVVPLGVMARLIIYNKDAQYRYRVGFFLMLSLALVLFIVLPTMPPRLLPSYHAEYIETGQIILSEHDATILEPYWSIIDTMKASETIYNKLHKEGGNPFAALPSMHTGWALWSCLTVLSTLDADNDDNAKTNLLQRIMAVGHVCCIVFVIITTGNHFWLDAVAGAACVLIGRVMAHCLIQWILDVCFSWPALSNLLQRLGPVKAQQQPPGDDWDDELTQELSPRRNGSMAVADIV